MRSISAGNTVEPETGRDPWQLRLFSKSLKKKQKFNLLATQIGDVSGSRCLLITNGDNNGALNYRFRENGGEWTWVENEPDNVPEMEELLGQAVLPGQPHRIPVGDATFDVVVSIDVHEHLDDCAPFSRELYRVVRPGGRVVVTTPNGSRWKPATVLKNCIGMTKEKYGHKVIGYTIAQHEGMLRGAGFEPTASGSYAGLFTELIELAINVVYVGMQARKGRASAGDIAPTSRSQLGAVEKQYRVYAAAYPLLLTVSKLDRVLFPFTGYAVSVVGRKPG